MKNATPSAKHKYGKKRVPGCRCDYNFTCGFCMRGVPAPDAEPVNEEKRDDFIASHFHIAIINS